jgi:hypothetical protein
MRGLLLLIAGVAALLAALAGGADVAVVVDVDAALTVHVAAADVSINGSSGLLASLATLSGTLAAVGRSADSLLSRVEALERRAAVAQWGCWGVCEGACGQPGVRRRLSAVPPGSVDATACEAPCFPDWRNLTAAGRAAFSEALALWVAPPGCHRDGDERLVVVGTNVPAGFQESVLAPNGLLYLAPWTEGQFLKIDPGDDSVVAFGPTSRGFISAVLAPNGDIYAIPFSSTRAARIRIADNSVDFFAEFDASSKWVGGVLAPNGCIYGIPYAAMGVLRVNTTNDSVSVFGALNATSRKYHGGVLGANGLIYAIPELATRVLVIDPETDRMWEMADLGINGWRYSVRDVRGSLFSFPYSPTTLETRGILRIDPGRNSSVIQREGSGSLFLNYVGAALGPNGYIYAAPSSGAVGVLRLKTATMESATLGDAVTGYRCPTLAPNGALYFSPFAVGNVLKLDFPYLPPMSLPLNALLSPFLN